MIPKLVDMYDAGAVTAPDVAVQCLHMIDPADPDLVLGQLPSDIIEAIQDFAEIYKPRGMKTNYGPIPTPDQVAAATRWIQAANVKIVSSD